MIEFLYDLSLGVAIVLAVLGAFAMVLATIGLAIACRECKHDKP